MGFEYEKSKLKNTISGTEGSFEFEKISQSVPKGQIEGTFRYQNMPLFSVSPKGLVYEYISFGGGFYFGTGHTFGEIITVSGPKIDFLYQMGVTSAIKPENENQFEYQQNKTISTPPTEGDFQYRRMS